MNWNGIVSLLFASIELLLFINLLIFAKKNTFNKIAIIIILLLFGFQTLEFVICFIELQNPVIAYLAFVDISFLPSFSLLITLNLTKHLQQNKIRYLLFIPPIAFAIYYQFVVDRFIVTGCTILYASFNYPLGDLFGFFYYLPIVISIILLMLFIKQKPERKQKTIAQILLFSSIFISLAPIVAFTLFALGSYKILSAVESIICKFAIVYAVSLSFACLINSPKQNE